jgi:hypothetical protein
LCSHLLIIYNKKIYNINIKMSGSTAVACPIECINRALICESPPDWLEKHSTFVLTLVASLSACVGVVFTYFLKSRCKKIKCCGLECDRSPIELNANEIEVMPNQQ